MNLQQHCRNGDLPLFLACRKPKLNVGILRKLIQVYPEAASMKSYGSTALHHLVHTGNDTLILLSNQI
jgi:hypothetical protein